MQLCQKTMCSGDVCNGYLSSIRHFGVGNVGDVIMRTSLLIGALCAKQLFFNPKRECANAGCIVVVQNYEKSVGQHMYALHPRLYDGHTSSHSAG